MTGNSSDADVVCTSMFFLAASFGYLVSLCPEILDASDSCFRSENRDIIFD